MKKNKDIIFISSVNEIIFNYENEEQAVVIEKLIKVLQEYFSASWCILRKINKLNTNLIIIAHTGLNDEEFSELNILHTNELVFDMLVVQKKSILVKDLNLDKRSFNEHYLKFGIKSFLVSPVLLNGSTIGSIKVYSRNLTKFNAKNQQMLEWFASKMGNILFKMNNQIQNEKIDYKGIITLLTLLEKKDKFTKNHSRNVSNISIKIARELNFSKFELMILEIAALLHDIGKILISNSILNKKGKLSDLEFFIMKKHAKTGSDCLRQGGYSEEICNIVEQHHERWDGKGYPKGISNNDICIGARIVSVADAYDAMINDRPYRKCLSHGKAIEEIKNCAGKQFDPNIINILIDNLSSIFDDEKINLPENE